MFLASIPHRLFLLAPTYPSPTPYIVTFHLVSGDAPGRQRKNETLKKRNVGRTLLFALFKKAFLWLWAGQKREKPSIFVLGLTDK